MRPTLDPSEEGEPAHARRLWCAVILQAITDARIQIGPVDTKGRGLEKERAVRWLTLPNRDFAHVCSLAGLDPKAVRERVAGMLASEDRGAPFNFSAFAGTGAPRQTQETTKIEFSA